MLRTAVPRGRRVIGTGLVGVVGYGRAWTQTAVRLVPVAEVAVVRIESNRGANANMDAVVPAGLKSMVRDPPEDGGGQGEACSGAGGGRGSGGGGGHGGDHGDGGGGEPR